MICAAVRALAALATQCRDHVTFCRTPHAGADRLWRETSRRDGADRLAEQEAEEEVSEPNEIVRPALDMEALALLKSDPEAYFEKTRRQPFAFREIAKDSLPRQPAYPPFNPSNHESSSVDGEAATVAGPPAEDSPVASVSADLDATGPPTCGSERHHRPAIHARCSRPTGHDGMHGYVDIFWRDKDPEK